MSLVDSAHRSPAAQDNANPVLLSVAFPYAAIGSRAVGGAEVICSQLEAALPQLGFRSVVVAHQDSRPVGQLYATEVPEGVITDSLRAEVEARQQVAIDRALAAHPVALVHMHGLDFHRYRVPSQLPVIVTLHLPPAWYPEAIWTLPGNYHLVCVSESQRRTCPVEAQSRVSVINNGVPLPDPATLRPEGRYALMLARICPEKNLHTGFDAARLAGMPAILAGEVFPYEAHLRYFEEEIKPRLTASGSGHETRHAPPTDSSGARFLGPVAGHEKQRLLQRAACLLLPSLAPETSSLVAMEALASGIPIVGLAVGAVPEIVDHGRTGWLVSPDGDIATHLSEALRKALKLDRSLCRSTAEQRFPLSRMIDAYAGLYRQLAPPSHPRFTPSSQLGRSSQTPQAEQETPDIPRSPQLLSSGPEQDRPTDLHKPQLLSSRPGQDSAADLPSPHVLSSRPERKARSGETRVTAPAPLTVTLLQTTEALNALQPEWTALYNADPTATPFQHPAWLLPWWRQFGPDGQLNTLALRDATSQQLLGLLPLYTYADPATHQRKLLLLGAGTTDYLDGLWSPAAPNAPGEALHHAFQQRHIWDEASLTQLRSDSLLTHAATTQSLPLPHAEPCSTLATSAELPSKMRINLGRYRRLAQSQGTLRSQLAETPVDALRIFDQLVRLHTQRWQVRGEDGVLRDPRVLAHHRKSLPLLLQAGLLRLFHLTLNDETLGVLYALADAPHAINRRLYLYLIGFDARFAALSPGSLLVHAAWQHAREHGFGKLDLLRGGETYKQLWGATPEPTFAIHLPRPPA